MKTQFVKKSTTTKQFYEKQPGIVRTLSSKYYISTGNEALDKLIVGYEIGTMACIKQSNVTNDHTMLIAYSIADALYTNQKCIVVGNPISQIPALSITNQITADTDAMKIAWRYNDSQQKEAIAFRYDLLKQIEKDKESQIIYLKAEGKTFKELYGEIVTAMQSSLKYYL